MLKYSFYIHTCLYSQPCISQALKTGSLFCLWCGLTIIITIIHTCECKCNSMQTQQVDPNLALTHLAGWTCPLGTYLYDLQEDRIFILTSFYLCMYKYSYPHILCVSHIHKSTREPSAVEHLREAKLSGYTSLCTHNYTTHVTHLTQLTNNLYMYVYHTLCYTRIHLYIRTSTYDQE